MTKEALKLALEALEDLGMKHFESTGEVLYKETFTAIKEALAQPEHIGFMDSKLNPIERTWVGLTKEERHEISMANRPYCADIMAAHEEELKRRNT